MRAADSATIETRNLKLEFDKNMHSRVVARFDGKGIVLGPFSTSETLTVDGGELSDFALTGVKQETVNDSLGAGRQTTLTGASGAVQKTVVITTHEKFPRMAMLQVQYVNKGTADLHVTGWTNNRYSIAAKEGDDAAAFWSYQGGSYQKRPDWVLPLKAGFKQENFLGMNSTDYGGGTPVVDVWRRDAGLGIGHLEMTAKLVSMPVAMPDADHAELGLSFRLDQTLKPGQSLDTFHSFAEVHQRDYFDTLRDYSQVMQAQGVKFQPAPASAFEPIWCAWGLWPYVYSDAGSGRAADSQETRFHLGWSG